MKGYDRSPIISKDNTEFEAWVNRQPQPPDGPKPVRRQVQMSFGAGVLFVGAGTLIGTAIMTLGITFWNKSGITAFVTLLATAIGLSVSLPVGLVVITDMAYGMHYRRMMRRTGWATYLDSLDSWRQEGYAEFSNLAKRNLQD